MLGELNELQIKNVLSSQALGRMACAEGELPYIIPVTYAYDGDFIYGQTNEGKKLDILRKNPNVCFEVDSMFDMRNWQCAIVHGKFEELSGLEADNARELLFNRVFPLKTSSTIHPFGHEVNDEIDDSTRIKVVMYRIKLVSFSGRFEKQ
ncbi:MAG: pyridoxamine 5'-phosphate oxidase family protein [Saprospiraceae bacterium]|jgi:hypothetical protein|nr:pyridoxamine 5'-phosphate oxidase family protein [Saprospiraceae bacterium]MBK7369989.1 pyridoxamine 5'-phosphate oxidase family protein [Saprospiraceae bacterium]MBK7438670.1 pyridoxamine 5'-phosphate oxidase family protein [Saprospiraceae bacterium]MBK8279069.1 pyridoxamine 5'-phosphate oxidase family protein [Saprospiraceae bacterium]MBK9678848.1 pyridoxamine 5'-phosphate oxidase family protein [Saprospiraceae bacterium]